MEVELCRKLGLRYSLERCSDGLIHAVPEIMTDAEIWAVLCLALGISEPEIAAAYLEFEPLWMERVLPQLMEVSRSHDRPMPPQPNSYTTLGKREAFGLYTVIKYKNVRSILEIGGATGFSAWFFKECLSMLGRKGQVYTIDADRDGLWLLPDSVSSTIDYTWESAFKLGSEEMFKHPVVKNFGLSEEVLPQLLPAVPFDFIFHDCAHTWQNTLFNVSECIRRCGDSVVHSCHDWRLPYRKNEDRYAERQVFNQCFGEGFCYFGIVELYGVGIAFRGT
jgi:hypothetical protein